MFESRLTATLKIAAKSSLLAFTVFLFVGVVYPCKCVKTSLQTSYKNADTVVFAKVIETTDSGDNTVKVEIEISNVWKADIPKRLIIIIEKDSCEYKMVNGEAHLLYLRKLESGNFTTDKCQGNLLENKSSKVKIWLKKYARKAQLQVS